MMSDAELGLNSFVKADVKDMRINVQEDATAKSVMLNLVEPAIASPKTIVYDGPTY